MPDTEKKEVPTVREESRPEEPTGRTWLVPALAAATAGAIAVMLLIWLLSGGSGGVSTGHTPVDESATSEAIKFATGEAIRQATREVEGATRTEIARSTHTAEARETDIASTHTASVVTAQAKLTAEAPATQTAEAVEYATTLARADATVQALNDQGKALPVQASGTLEQSNASEVACSAPAATSSDFEAEVHFQNPAPVSQQTLAQTWDYGLIFAHPYDALQYRMILDSTGMWTLNLHTDGYDIENRDSTPLLDPSEQGSNTLKLAISGEEAHLYINGTFIDTLDLTMFEEGGGSDAGYDVAVCAGIMQESAAAGRVTLYDGYTLRSLP